MYSCTAHELRSRERFIGYVSLENRELLEVARVRAGHAGPSAFATQRTNHWIGAPDGLSSPD